MSSTLAPSVHPGDDRPSKRQRTDQDAQSQPTEVRITKSDVVWMPAGDLVIRTVEQGPDEPYVTHTLYRVHRPVLALYSAVFASMFEGDQAAFEVASEIYEGVPLMELPDAAEDVEHFLDAMHNPRRLRKHLPALEDGTLHSARWPEFPESYIGILRLATKYEAQDMREQVVTALTMLWPTHPEDWSAVEAVANLGPEYREPGKYIRLAKAYDIPDILPALFYDLARATEQPLADMAQELRELYMADLTLLTPGEMRCLVVGKTSLQNLAENFTACYVAHSRTTCICDLSTGCFGAATKWWNNNMDVSKASDCLQKLSHLEKILLQCEVKDVCRFRQHHIRGEIVKIRRYLWGALPDLFGTEDEGATLTISV
ncbi:hypothetical protein FA95DRAFT_1607273 [Auriscalpium vulgare]|uniref:Uncharacterized protein n=1 Tax=Auriscalpium vulgare TaxID=40419 RepID=A0ACB8RPE1_9AGAM|nr:hypothetical protein FA95DRAFT_1607273 [Auriscalpium vulgare]